MPDPGSVQIPYQTFKQMIAICEEMKYLIDVHNLNFGYYSDLEDVLNVLEAKKHKLELRQSYGKLAAVNKGTDEEKKHQARIEYLRKRGARP